MTSLLRRACFVGVCIVAAGCSRPLPANRPATSPASIPAAPANATLYRRLGGYDAIAAVTDDFIGRMLGDPRMAPYFENVDDKGKKHLRQMLVDQLCAVTGGPCLYVGADMPTAHKDLDISDRAFDVAAQYLGESLDTFHVGPRERTELIGIVASTRKDIVGK